ncbi:hypothetical protein QF043_000532 [Pseudomonas sp. W3I7]|jgi:hypothetical protein|nr:hypothetical protein [Pseudomonas sp. W3I7]
MTQMILELTSSAPVGSGLSITLTCKGSLKVELANPISNISVIPLFMPDR